MPKKVIFISLGILVLLMASWVLFNKNPYAENFSIPTESMAPTLISGDIIRVDKTTKNPNRGDVYVYFNPISGIPYVFRVLGMPGETIQMKNGRLYINDKIVPREPLEEAKHLDKHSSDKASVYFEYPPQSLPILIHEKTDEEPLDNTPIYKIPSNNYFMLGDNRDNSADSRVIALHGFVPKEKLIGKAIYFLYSRNTDKIGKEIF